MPAFQYKMVQIPRSVVVSKEDEVTGAASSYLEQIANKMAAQGWEFFRVDSINVAVQPGCWGWLTGQRQSITTYYVVTFRKQTAVKSLQEKRESR